MIIEGPIPKLLDRSPLAGGAGQAFKELVWVLERDVNMGTHVLSWAIAKPGGLCTWETVAVTFARQAVELGDASAELIRNRIDRPCIHMARAIFEVWLQLEYLLREDRLRRARCYTFCDMAATRAAARVAIAEAEETGIEAGESADTVVGRAAYQAREALPSIERVLRQEHYAEILSEFDSKRRVPAWYSLFQGPHTLRDLADKLGKERYYLRLYKPWSSHAHGERAMDAFSLRADGTGVIEGFRNGMDAPSTTLVIHSMLVAIGQMLVAAVVPEKKAALDGWYQKQGRSKLEWMSRLKFHPPPEPAEAAARDE